jgi:oligoendopeptidase F
MSERGERAQADPEIPPGARLPEWEPSSLFPDPHSPVIDDLLNGALRDAQAMADEFTGRMSGLDAGRLQEAIRRYECCIARVQEVSCYGELLQADARLQPQAAALLSRCDRAWADLASTLAFFEAELGEWKAGAPSSLDSYANFIGKVQASAARTLPDMQESILARLLPTGGEGWGRLAQQLLARLAVDVDGAARSIGEVLPGLYEADRAARAGTHAAVSRALVDQVEIRAFALAMAVADHEARAELRNADWLAERRILDQVRQGELDELLTAADECLPLIHDYYAFKREFLAIDDFADYDRYAPLGSLPPEITWGEALNVALAAMESISPVFAELSRNVIDSGRIDAGPRPGKRRSASTQAIPGQLPFISMNFTGKPRDILTLAHELGHAVYLQLAAEQPYLAATPAPVMAETVALFCEGMSVRRLLAGSPDAGVRLGWLARWLEDQMVAVGRHAALHRFEVALHDQARSGGGLDAARIGELWAEGQRRLYGPAVRLTDEYCTWWSYLDSLFTTPGSNYAYVYGQLSALTLLRRFEDDPADVGQRLVAMLRLGDSRPPAELLGALTEGRSNLWGEAVTQLAFWLDELRALTDFRSSHAAGSGKSQP